MLQCIWENKRILNMHEKRFSKLDNFQANTTVFQANTNYSLKNLELQIGQLALTMQNQSKDSFPSNTRKNPRDCMVVTLRSGRDLEERRNEKKYTEEEEAAKMQPEQKVEKENLGKKEQIKAYEPQVPFPQRLQTEKLEEQFSKFLDIFKYIEINIPFSEALTQMPLYAKFMKEILSRKRKIAEEGIVSLTPTCSIVIQNSLPKKIQDLGSFTIPCEIGHADVGKTLCDSRANINLMPLSVAK